MALTSVLFVVVLLILPVVATLLSALGRRYSRQRRMFHILPAWALPVVGPGLVFFFEAKSPKTAGVSERSDIATPDFLSPVVESSLSHLRDHEPH
jgi:hypothetical protein